MSEKNQDAENDNRVNVKHGAPAHSRIANREGLRNSSIEMLRIIAMFMILMSHFIGHNGYDVLKLPLGPERIFFQLVMRSGGAIGVVIFFSISAWFFLDREQTIKSNLKRVWIMERELLFWSLILVTFYLVFDRADLGMKLMVKSVMPLSMGVWWYATAYAIFLALLPFLSKGLKALGREYHLKLAATVLVIWGLTSFIPEMIGINDGFLGFIYLFILISAYKWYMKPFTTKQVWLMTGIGLGFFLLYTAASATLSLLGHDMGIFITGSWKLPVIMVASACSYCSTASPSIAASSTGSRNPRSPCTSSPTTPHPRNCSGSDCSICRTSTSSHWRFCKFSASCWRSTPYALCLTSSARHCSPPPSTGVADAGSSCCGIKHPLGLTAWHEPFACPSIAYGAGEIPAPFGENPIVGLRN